MNLNININAHVWPAATILNSAADSGSLMLVLDDFTSDCPHELMDPNTPKLRPPPTPKKRKGGKKKRQRERKEGRREYLPWTLALWSVGVANLQAWLGSAFGALQTFPPKLYLLTVYFKYSGPHKTLQTQFLNLVWIVLKRTSSQCMIRWLRILKIHLKIVWYCSSNFS